MKQDTSTRNDDHASASVTNKGRQVAPNRAGGQPLLVGVVEAARLTGLSPRTVWRYASSGRFLSPVRLGGRRLWNRAKLIEWVNSGCPRIERDYQ